MWRAWYRAEMLAVALFGLAITVLCIYGIVGLAKKYEAASSKAAIVLGIVCLSGFTLMGLLVTGVAGGCAALGK
jgi:hypothetical protein